MYLRYLHEGHIKTQFYRVERLKESATGANLADLVKIRFQRDNIDLTQLQFVGSDGAANMTGKKSGFVAQMKKENPHVVGIWCVNHRLALSVGDTVKSLQWLKRYEGTVQQINKLFEYSPEKTRKLEQISDQYEATFSSDRRKKFVRPAATRWTSHERANDAIYHGYEVLLQTLHYFTEEARVPDATAAGLYTFCRKYMFIGTVYILQTVLPIVGKLARLWQKDVLVFSEVKPLTRAAIDKLTTLKQTREPTLELRAEFEGSGRFSDGEIQFTDKNDAKLDQFYDTLLTELCENLESRLALTPFLEAFELFDPCRFPGVNDKQYGKDEISLLCTHYELDEEKTQDEWCNFRYKFESPPMSTKNTAGEVCEVVVQQRNVLGDEYPNLCKLAELALLIPMSNAWPERGASCLKRIKSRLRNRMKGDLLQAIMTIDLNHGAGDEDITDSVTAWRNKPRRNVFGTAHREDIHDSTMQSLSELVDSLTAKHRELMKLVCYNDEQDADEDSVADKKEQTPSPFSRSEAGSVKLQNSEILENLESTKLAHLQPSQQQQVKELIQEYKHLFQDIPTKTNVIYHDVDVRDKRASEIIAFVTPDELFQYKVMPFGMKNSPPTFLRMINDVICGQEGCEAYVDYVVLYSDTWRTTSNSCRSSLRD
ncbi:zinc finger protein 862-like [Ptychodera flava]|uniref:zinc finger protein 862-like n=1 Tax=Ptychodera flava TaxID=63121 RepID=UPI00396A1F3F